MCRHGTVTRRVFRWRRQLGWSRGTSQTLATVTGTLSIGGSQSATAMSRAQSSRLRPEFVSPATGHVALFIDGAAAAAGAITGAGCTPTTGTGTSCTIPWSAQLTVPASHVFAVETDSGTAGVPNNTVLSVGAQTYAIVAGANTLAALSLNGVVKDATFAITGCATNTCNGTVTLAAAAGNAISYTGATAVPTNGNAPSSGNIFDNGPVTLASSNTVAGTGGLVTGTAQAPFSTYAPNTLSVVGVNTTGVYTYAATCNATATGTFGITLADAAGTSGLVTTAELGGLAPAVAYPATGLTVLGTAPSFSCTAGTIGSATGTLPVN